MAAPAQLANQGYEAGLEGWVSSGDVTTPLQVVASSSMGGWVITPPQTEMAVLPSNSTGLQELDTFFGLNAGTIDAALAGDVNSGAAIKQSFTGLAGDTLTQYWNFASLGDTSDTSFNDSAFVIFNGEATVLASVENGGIEVGSHGHTGWQSFSYTLPADGTYTLGFGVVSMQDTVSYSMLFLDDQPGGDWTLPGMPPIPEPEIYAMLLVGLALIGVMTKRKSLSATAV